MIRLFSYTISLLMIFSTLATGCGQTFYRPPEPQNEAQYTEVLPFVPPVKLPDSLAFAGESVPLKDQEIRERLDKELVINAYMHSATVLVIKEAARWKKMITDKLKENNIPEDFFYLAVAESKLSNNAISSRNAVGMWQFMEETAKEYGLEVNDYIDQRRDPELSTVAACKYLTNAYKQFGNWTLVAASYNRGMMGVQNAISMQKVQSYYDLYLTEESYRYVFRILAIKTILENPEDYGFSATEMEMYTPWKYTSLVIESSITDLPAFALSQQTTYKELRRLNPWITGKDYQLIFKAGKKYDLRIPLK